MASRRALALMEKAALPMGRTYIRRQYVLCQSRELLTTYDSFGANQESVRSYGVVAGSEHPLSNSGYSRRTTVVGQHAKMRSSGILSSSSADRGFASVSDIPHVAIGMPSLSPTMTQGNIAKWHKKEGDQLAAGDVLCEIETDKATLEMETMDEGFLAKIVHQEGAKDLPVGTTIAIVVENEEDVPKFADYTGDSAGAGAPAPAPKETAAPPPPPPPSTPAPVAAAAPPSPAPPPPPSPSGRAFATPAARQLAEAKGVNLASIKGTGVDGSILKADVEDFLAAGPPKAAPVAAVPYEGVSYIDLPHTQIRKITAARLLQSKQTVPHYYLTIDSRVDNLNKLRTQLNAAQASSGGKKLSVNDFVIKAAALALKKVPEVNASWTDEFIRQYNNVDVSVAVQTDFGLMVPIVKDADKKGVAGISEDVKRLAEKARENKLAPAEFMGGTFTISNLGMFGVKQFCAIINPPQSCILAVGTTEKRVVPSATAERGYEVATYLTTTLSCDHRVVDGALGAQWLQAFKGYLEDPLTMLL